MAVPLVILALGGAAWAKEEGATPAETAGAAIGERETLTGNWFGAGDALADAGISLSLSATQVFQFNLEGGLSTHRHAGRYAGSYDLELELDLERVAGLKGGTIYVAAEGSWSEGLDASSVGSLMGLNDDAGGDRAIDITEFWFEQALCDGKVVFRVGKIDLTGGFEHHGCPVAFDCNAFAGDETTQFLSSPLVNNPTIPFPENGLGAAVYVHLADWAYVAAGVADAQADARETGFNTAFSDEDYVVSIYEGGVTPVLRSANGPLQGVWRVGFWVDHPPKAYLDGSGSKRDDTGLYVSCDQMLWRETADPEDAQGLGWFARYGRADARLNEIRHFWSTGFQYQGLIRGRDDDVLGFGVARARLSGDAGYSARHETLYEFYYRAQVAPWLAVGPHVQHVVHPGGDSSVGDATVVGVRVQASF